MKKTVFLFSGEGTNNSESEFKLLKHSKYWSEIQSVLNSKLDLDLEEIWKSEIGKHRCPYSPLITVVSQICLSDIWNQWGYKPDILIGHSIGELAAAYQAGLYSLEDTLLLTYQIGAMTSNLTGTMLHGALSDQQIDQLPVTLSAFNFEVDSKKHVTLSGYDDEMSGFLDANPDFVKMKLPHPWHHPDYRNFHHQIKNLKSNKIDDFKFVSGVTANFENHLEDEYWKKWSTHPIDFIHSMQTIKEKYNENHLDIIEIGFHPVLGKCCEIFDEYRYVSSMFRGEDEIKWILHQRKMLDQEPFLNEIKRSIDDFKPQLDFDTSLAYQGFDSLAFVELSATLQRFFPSLSPQDFYRYKTINQLIDQFGIDQSSELSLNSKFEKHEVVIAAMSCKFPSSIENLTQFWEVLLSNEDQVKGNADRGDYEAGFLNDHITRFDHKYFNISDAEAQAMDPQQILALELTELLWKDAGIDPDKLDKKRIGVYIGVWNQEYAGKNDSVYYPTGTNPSIIASRISYHYDLRGPSWVSNTACSSSLVAVHYAAKDIEDGRIDYAIAGGVNMLLGNDFTHYMRNSGFLSEDYRCKTFDNSANGYVRAEGGGLVLLANKNLADDYYAELLGSSVNQNGRRAQTITAPHPEAQEELILDACRDAAILPQDISYLECHGTGTKIGDPIEISAIQNTVAKDRKDICFLGAVKSNIGHLESAAGIAGLIKSVLILTNGIIPPNLHFNKPNQYIDFKSYPLKIVSEKTKIDNEANIGISSFGFGGVNAHVIIKGVNGHVKKKVKNFEIPFDRNRSLSLKEFYQLNAGQLPNAGEPLQRIENDFDTEKFIKTLFSNITSIEEIDPEVELLEQGLDSVAALEFITNLEQEFEIELDEEFLFDFPLIDQVIAEIDNKISDANHDAISVRN
jgi:acyl transferase domain-containing protein/acyl carrier protein